jgi:glycosyltransferase involved in cell wall biosynthesis
MDLVAEMLIDQWNGRPVEGVHARLLSIRFPRIARRLPGSADKKLARNADRALGRYLAYPLRAALSRRPGRLFHIVDHSYAQLVHALPAGRTGVYCHDLDVFRPLIEPRMHDRGPAFRALAWTLARGLRSAAVVFHNSRAVGQALSDSDLVPSSRLVYAPLGVAPEFHPRAEPLADAATVHERLNGRPFLLHVGSEIARKRVDVVFEVFARLRRMHPDLALVQQGARLTVAQRTLVETLGIADALIQPPRLSRKGLASLYRRAAIVLVPSEAEGFGIPVIEAMACGAIVVASDIPVLREVGGGGALYASVGDVPAWTNLADALVRRNTVAPPLETRAEQAAQFTWERHAATILDAYRGIQRGAVKPR